MISRHSDPSSFVCETCGQTHPGLAFDIAFAKPGAFFAVPEQSRPVRCWLTTDLAVIDGKRFFIRGVLYIPVLGTGRSFGWGFWAEVAKRAFNRYMELYNADGSTEPPCKGTLSVEPGAHAGYKGLNGLPVSIQFGLPEHRPTFQLDASDHPLHREQKEGITPHRHYEILQMLKEAG